MESTDQEIGIKGESSLDSNVCKFTVDRPIYPGGSFNCRTKEMANGSPLLEALFAIEGVTEVLIAGNSITVAKSSHENWPVMGKKIGAAIRSQIKLGGLLLATDLNATAPEKLNPSSPETIILSRNCDAVQIPSGDKVKLTSGSGVRITQSLGDTFTVITDEGLMVRISGQDADTLGLKPALESGKPSEAKGKSLEELVWDVLKTTFDPEIPVNIVDLGLVYVCKVHPVTSDANKVEIRFTLTAAGCGMGDVLKGDIESKLKQISGISEVDVQVVLEPVWDKNMMSEAAKLQLGLL